MNRTEIKSFLPILQAFADGKEIECREEDKWYKVLEICNEMNPQDYRIKPEPKYRPFKDADEYWQEMSKHQPFGWIKAIPNKEYKAKYYPNSKDDADLYYQVQKVAPGYIKYDDINDYCEIGEQDKSYKDVFKVITFADGTPFGILE